MSEARTTLYQEWPWLLNSFAEVPPLNCCDFCAHHPQNVQSPCQAEVHPSGVIIVMVAMHLLVMMSDEWSFYADVMRPGSPCFIMTVIFKGVRQAAATPSALQLDWI